ncbi:MAG: hypothetical protein ACJAYU_004703 [Bradymonadia bacterium]|jgi:hypothetical protein
MTRAILILATLLLASVAPDTASARDAERENAGLEETVNPTHTDLQRSADTVNPTHTDLRRTGEAVEDEHTETLAVAELCGAYEDGSPASDQCTEVFGDMDSDRDGRIAPEEFNGKYGDILIDGVPLEFD